MQRVVQEEERKAESAWLRVVTPSCCDVELVLTKLMANRYSVDILVSIKVMDNIPRKVDSFWLKS
jgi:NADH:ubiquinone oxidoreductase subunit B-like Fe-S oxidoreductase